MNGMYTRRNFAGLSVCTSAELALSRRKLPGQETIQPAMVLQEQATAAAAMAATSNLQLAGNATRMIPGHGPVGFKPQLAEFHKMLAAVWENGAELKQQGKSLNEVNVAKNAGYYTNWGGGCDEFWVLRRWSIREFRVDFCETAQVQSRNMRIRSW